MDVVVVSRRRFRGFRAGAATLLAAFCAIAQAEFVSLPGSTLVSRPDLRFLLDQRSHGGTGQSATLLHETPGSEPTRVAVIEASEREGRARVEIRSLGASGEVGVVALERLYTLALRMNPEAGFCFSLAAKTCDVLAESRSQGEILREIARARETELSRSGTAARIWGAVAMEAVASDSRQDPDVVSVRLTSAAKPLRDVRLFFNQAPHSACVARTDAGGVAMCRLVDQHADEDAHAGESRAVVATFPGDVSGAVLLPPTTFIVRAGRS